MVLIILRHGQSVWNALNKFTGFTNVKLTSKGINEAKNSCNQLKKYNIDYCFTSDLDRAIKTAEIIKDELNQDFTIKKFKDLKERDYGELTGLNKDEIEEKVGKIQSHKWRKTFYGRPPNGENLDDVLKRVGRCYDNNIKNYNIDNKNILIVGHNNSLRALLVHLGIKDIDNIEKFKFNNCEPLIIDNK